MRPGRRIDMMKTLGKCDAGQERLMVNYRYWANSEWLQTGISAVKAGGTPALSPAAQHRTRKEDRHARRMDLTSTRGNHLHTGGRPPVHGRPAAGTARVAHLAARPTAMTAPRQPLTAIMAPGPARPASAPTMTNQTPWNTCMPPLARPNAWPRRSGGTAATNAEFAATW